MYMPLPFFVSGVRECWCGHTRAGTHRNTDSYIMVPKRHAKRASASKFSNADSVLAMLKALATPSGTPTPTTTATSTPGVCQPASSPASSSNTQTGDQKDPTSSGYLGDKPEQTDAEVKNIEPTHACMTTKATEDTSFEKDFGLTLQDLFRDVDKGATTGLLKDLNDLKVDDWAEQLPKIFPSSFNEGQNKDEAGASVGCEMPKSRLMEELEAASSSDWRFNMQGVLGRLWADAKKQDADLNARYLQCGRLYKKQREFRAEWAKAQHERITVSKKFKQTSSQAQFDEGTYLPFDCIVDAEGGPTRRASVKTALSYVMACLQMHRRGVMCGPVSWVRQNGMTQRMEFLYLKKGYSSRYTSAWSTAQEEISETKAAGSEEQHIADHSPAKARSAASKAKRNTEADNGEKKKAQKQLQTGFKKLSELRLKLATALTAGTDVLNRIERDQKWEWAKGNLAQDLREALGGPPKKGGHGVSVSGAGGGLRRMAVGCPAQVLRYALGHAHGAAYVRRRLAPSQIWRDV